MADPVERKGAKMTNNSQVNIFTMYKQPENDYTNGFVSLLRLASLGHPRLLNQLLNDQLQPGLPGTFNPDNFRVLSGIEGYADGEVSAEDFCIWFETKIESGSLREAQVHQHLINLNAKPQARRYLVLLTPDDSRSSYIKRFLSIDPRICHLEWRRVYDLLKGRDTDSVFSALAHQFREHIKKYIFEQDIAGCILKVNFGKKSGVDEGRYLDELKANEWPCWNTPRQYTSLDGTGRKLLLYDSTRQEITIEFEIGNVDKNSKEADYPWRNEIIQKSIYIFDPPISLERIRSLENFQNFTKGQSPFRNLTQEQYRQLVGQTSS